MASVIAGQMVSFAVMLALGAFCAWRGIVKRASLRSMIALSTKIFLPALVFSTICKRMDKGLLESHAPLILLTAVFYVAVILVVRALAHGLKLGPRRTGAFCMSFIFGNTGFIGLPILLAVFPKTGAANLILFMLVDQMVFWTFGVSLVGEGNVGSWRTSLKGFFNPNVVAMMLALACLAFDIPVCATAVDIMSTIGAAATPLCMVCLGAMCCPQDIKRVLCSRELYVGVVVKMLGMALLAAPLLRLLPLASDVVSSMVLMIAMPPTTLVPLAVEANGGDGPYATALSVMAIACSVLTLPLVAYLIGV